VRCFVNALGVLDNVREAVRRAGSHPIRGLAGRRAPAASAGEITKFS